MNIARLGNKYLADTEPWKLIKTDPERVKTILNIALQITANLSIAIEPFMPFSAKKIVGMLQAGPSAGRNWAAPTCSLPDIGSAKPCFSSKRSRTT